jgi:WD40 repeat protein
VEPYRETFRRVFPNGGIGIVEMLFRTNLLALVGGGRNPRFPPNKVMIWDDHQNRCIGELSFRSEVKAVKLRRDRVVVVLSTKIYVYRFSDLHLQDQMNTLPNPRGLVALCPDNNNTVLACPGINKGSVRVELYDSRKSTLIPAHESELAQIALNLDGTRLATASDKGTLIRVCLSVRT